VEPAPPPVKSPGDAVADVPELERIKPLNPLIVADIADAMWRQAAAAPGYAGIPYDAANPITAADATAIKTQILVRGRPSVISFLHKLRRQVRPPVRRLCCPLARRLSQNKTRRRHQRLAPIHQRSRCKIWGQTLASVHPR